MVVTVQDLPDILASHRKWALAEVDGKRAKLRGATTRDWTAQTEFISF